MTLTYILKQNNLIYSWAYSHNKQFDIYNLSCNNENPKNYINKKFDSTAKYEYVVDDVITNSNKPIKTDAELDKLIYLKVGSDS